MWPRVEKLSEEAVTREYISAVRSFARSWKGVGWTLDGPVDGRQCRAMSAWHGYLKRQEDDPG